MARPNYHNEPPPPFSPSVPEVSDVEGKIQQLKRKNEELTDKVENCQKDLVMLKLKVDEKIDVGDSVFITFVTLVVFFLIMGALVKMSGRPFY